MANGTAFFSRFTMKFVEVIGAGIATAVTGYLIAHLGGFWSTPRTPAAIPASVEMAPAPAVSTMPKSARVSPPPLPAAVDIASPAAKLDKPSDKPSEKPPLKPDAVAEKEPAAASTPSARATPARKSSAGEAKSYEPKSREPKASEAKLRERDDTASVEEQVRAALAKVDAGRRPLAEPAAPIESPAVMPSVAVAPPPAIAAPIAPTVASVPPVPAPAAVSATPPAVAAVSPPTAIAPPLVGTVEIKSEPVATVEAMPAAAPPDNGKSKDRGFLATIEHIPDMLRPTAGATTAEPPRPPMPVGDSQ